MSSVVQVEHRNVVNQLQHFQQRLPLATGSTVMAVTTLTFDPCICELYWPLAYGAKVTPPHSGPGRLSLASMHR